jgi:hypothetical protein
MVRDDQVAARRSVADDRHHDQRDMGKFGDFEQVCHLLGHKRR